MLKDSVVWWLKKHLISEKSQCPPVNKYSILNLFPWEAKSKRPKERWGVRERLEVFQNFIWLSCILKTREEPITLYISCVKKFDKDF